MKKPERPPIYDDNVIKYEIINDRKAFGELKEIEKDHLYWEDFKYKTKNRPSLQKYDPKDLWNAAQFILRTFSHLRIGGIYIKYSTPRKILELLHQFDLDLGGTIQSDVIIQDHQKEHYLLSSIMEEAIASSQLEGASTTRKVAKEMLRANRKPKTLSERMILNNYLTIKEILKIKDKKLTKSLITEVHAIVSKDTLEKKEYEGAFRKNNEIKVVDALTGEVFYDPPDHKVLNQLIQDLCDSFNSKDDTFIHPIVKGIMLHFLIGYIHPFVDGNGRTARALFYWYLMKQGYWIIEYLSISRIILKSPAKYSRAYLYTEYDENDLTYFIDYNLTCLSKALDEFKKYVKRQIAEKKEAYQLVKTEDVNERQAQILHKFIHEPDVIMTIKEVESLYGVVYQTARTDLLDLVQKGYLQSKMDGKKMIFFKE